VTELAQTLVGRQAELDLLERMLEEGCAGSPQIVSVTGEPGIGKSSLLAELLRRAEERGCLALRGSAAQFEGDLPFGLIIDALDEYLESLAPSAFHSLQTESLAELGGVFPALRSLDPGSDEPTTAAERHRAYRAARELLEHLADKRSSSCSMIFTGPTARRSNSFRISSGVLPVPVLCWPWGFARDRPPTRPKR